MRVQYNWVKHHALDKLPLNTTIMACRLYRYQLHIEKCTKSRRMYLLQMYNLFRRESIKRIRVLEDKLNLPHRPAELLKPPPRFIGLINPEFGQYYYAEFERA